MYYLAFMVRNFMGFIHLTPITFTKGYHVASVVPGIYTKGCFSLVLGKRLRLNFALLTMEPLYELLNIIPRLDSHPTLQVGQYLKS